MEALRIRRYLLEHGIKKGTGRNNPIARTDPARIIGQRINPSGRKALRQALTDGEWDYVLRGGPSNRLKPGQNSWTSTSAGRELMEAVVLPEAVETDRGPGT